MLYKEIESVYNLKSGFVDMYLKHLGLSSIPDSIFELHRNEQPQKMYVEFALSCINRGINARDSLLRHVEYLGKNQIVQGGNFLDIGTAYGGFLVAFSEIGMNVLGIEIHKKLCSLGLQNCKDHNILFYNEPAVICDDFLSYDFSKYKKFDIIACNDVIEHVNDPKYTLEKISHLLSSNGIVFLEIPNSKSIDHIIKDGHMNLFGINLLDHHQAKAYANQLGIEYSCGEFYSLDWYVNLLQSLGLKTKILQNSQSDLTEKSIVESILRLTNQFTFSYMNEFNRLDMHLQYTLTNKYLDYMNNMYKAFFRYHLTNDIESFEINYSRSFWSVAAWR